MWNENKSYNLAKIRRNETKSCGHLKLCHDKPNKVNRIINMGTHGVIYTDKCEYLFDLEDYEYLENKWWYTDDYGYLTHCKRINKHNHYVRFHRLVTKASSGEYVDHINKNKCDCRKTNLRVCKHKENDRNKGLRTNNKSGIVGVSYDKSRDKWLASLTYDYKTIHLGRYNEKKEAIKARLIAELEYFKDYAPQQHLCKSYFTSEELDSIKNRKGIQKNENNI